MKAPEKEVTFHLAHRHHARRYLLGDTFWVGPRLSRWGRVVNWVRRFLGRPSSGGRRMVVVAVDYQEGTVTARAR